MKQESVTTWIGDKSPCFVAAYSVKFIREGNIVSAYQILSKCAKSREYQSIYKDAIGILVTNILECYRINSYKEEAENRIIQLRLISLLKETYCISDKLIANLMKYITEPKINKISYEKGKTKAKVIRPKQFTREEAV